MNREAIYARILDEVRKEFGLEAGAAFIAKEVRKRIDALPADQRDAVNEYLEEVASFKPPGFHEHGPH